MSQDTGKLSRTNQPMKRFCIKQITPFPGRTEDIPRWMLQEAEYKLQLAKTHFHECAEKRDGRYYYTATDAARIVRYWWHWPGVRWIERL